MIKNMKTTRFCRVNLDSKNPNLQAKMCSDDVLLIETLGIEASFVAHFRAGHRFVEKR